MVKETAGAAARPPKGALSVKWKRTVYDFKQNKDCYLYIAPFFIIFFLFTVLPVLISIFYGFTYYNVLQPPKFIGLQNYINLFANDDIFLIALKNTIIISVFTGPIGYLLSLIFAWFISELSPKMRAFMVTVLYAPSLSGNALMIWTVLFSGDSYGYLNSFLIRYGISTSPVQFFSDPNYMMTILIIIMIWMSMGTGFLGFVAGFQTIDRTQYEAGYVEGIRNRWQELWFITLPAIKPQMLFGAVMSITGSFGVGGIANTLFGNPSTDYATWTIVNHLEDYGGARFEMGYACAIATILFLIMVGANKLVQRMLSKVGT